MEKIKKELQVAEQVYRNSLLQSDYNTILKLKYEYDTILGAQIGNLLLKLKQNHLKLSDKPQKLLARQLKGEQTKQAIYKIKPKSGDMITNLKDINNCFKEFYFEIYTSKSTATQKDFDSFFNSLHFPKLDAAFWESLDSVFSQDAITTFPASVLRLQLGFLWRTYFL